MGWEYAVLSPQANRVEVGDKKANASNVAATFLIFFIIFSSLDKIKRANGAYPLYLAFFRFVNRRKKAEKARVNKPTQKFQKTKRIFPKISSCVKILQYAELQKPFAYAIMKSGEFL
jgi:hypothetical protein